MTAPSKPRPTQITYPKALPGVVEDWRTQSLCRDWIDDDVWCPDDPKQAQFGKSICNGANGRPACPVKEQCLAASLARREKWGTYGGLDEWERYLLLHPNASRVPRKRRIA